MRRNAIALVASIVLFLVAGPVAAASQDRPGGVPSPGAAILSDLRAFRATKTLADWRAAHPQDDIGPAARNGEGAGIAASASLRVAVAVAATTAVAVANGGTLKRFVAFYPPPAAGLTLPRPGVASREILDTAVPGYLWLEMAVPAADAAAALLSETTGAVAAELGSGESGAKIAAFGSAFWRNTVLWTGSEFEVAIGLTGGPAPKEGSPVRVIAVASLPPSHAPVGFWKRSAALGAGDSGAGAAERADRLRRVVEEALALAAVGGEAETAIGVLVAHVTPEVFDDPGPQGSPDTVLAALTRWLDTTRDFPRPRRAAALLVADQVLQGTLHSFGIADADGPNAAKARATRDALARLGAGFNHVELGATWAYTNTWLREALALDPDGRAGEMAFVVLLEKGFETSGKCGDQQGEGFATVIEKGEAYLRSKRAETSPNRADVLFALARANSDYVALGVGGMGYEGFAGAEEKKFKGLATRGRVQALDYYRVALALEQDSLRAREARVEVWRLAAGVAPSRTYFYCVYD